MSATGFQRARRELLKAEKLPKVKVVKQTKHKPDITPIKTVEKDMVDLDLGLDLANIDFEEKKPKSTRKGKK